MRAGRRSARRPCTAARRRPPPPPRRTAGAGALLASVGAPFGNRGGRKGRLWRRVSGMPCSQRPHHAKCSSPVAGAHEWNLQLSSRPQVDPHSSSSYQSEACQSTLGHLGCRGGHERGRAARGGDELAGRGAHASCWARPAPPTSPSGAAPPPPDRIQPPAPRRRHPCAPQFARQLTGVPAKTPQHSPRPRFPAGGPGRGRLVCCQSGTAAPGSGGRSWASAP